MDAATTDNGQTLYIDRTDGKKGSKAPFYVVYAGEDAENRWGYYCGHCETFDTAMDSMGRVQCNRCANITKADEWDAAHE